MKKRILSLLLAALLLLTACAKAPTWQEQYDLGVRYLSEGNYQEAVIAFAAAIEIDDKQPAAYTGLAEAYLQSGDVERARETLQQGVDKTGDAGLQQRLEEVDGRTTSEGQAVEFTARENYCAFEELSAEEQQLMEAAVTAAIAGDTDTIRGFLSTFDSLEIGAYTMWDDYKVFVFKHVYNANNDMVLEDGSGVFDNDVIEIELHPENGTGYYCNYGYCPVTNREATEWTYCSCVNWQWNGEYVSTVTIRDAETMSNQTIKGTMKDGVRHGVFIRESVYTPSPIPGETPTFRDELLYQDGVLIDQKMYQDRELTYEMDEETRQSSANDIWGIPETYFSDEQRYW